MRPSFVAFSTILLSVFVLGCATILSGTSDNVTIESEPPGATILIDGIEYGKTPATISITRPGFDQKEVTLEMRGYQRRTFILKKEFNTIAVLNLGNALGWAIDIVSGAVFKYNPRQYKLDLKAQGASYNLKDLDQFANGSFLIPEESNGIVSVTDEDTGVQLIFMNR